MPSFDEAYGQSAAQNAQPNASSEPSSNGSVQPSASSAPDPSSLPPAALELAARLFDLARNGETVRFIPF